jgi:hypothetical protein
VCSETKSGCRWSNFRLGNDIMTTRRARTRFRVAEHASGQPFIVLEPLSGDKLEMFAKGVGFDLPENTTYDEASEISDYLNAKLIHVAEW